MNIVAVLGHSGGESVEEGKVRGINSGENLSARCRHTTPKRQPDNATDCRQRNPSYGDRQATSSRHLSNMFSTVEGPLSPSRNPWLPNNKRARSCPWQRFDPTPNYYCY